MEETLLEKMQKAKDQYGIAYVSYCNDGKVIEDRNYMTTNMKLLDTDSPFNNMGSALYKTVELFSRVPYDTAVMDLELGLMFKGSDLDQNQKLKSVARPLDGIVRYETGKIDFFLDEEKVNKVDYGEYYAQGGYIRYNQMVDAIRKNGLEFNGPETFEDFEEAILNGETFDINVSAKFKTKEKAKQFVKRK